MALMIQPHQIKKEPLLDSPDPLDTKGSAVHHSRVFTTDDVGSKWLRTNAEDDVSLTQNFSSSRTDDDVSNTTSCTTDDITIKTPKHQRDVSRLTTDDNKTKTRDVSSQTLYSNDIDASRQTVTCENLSKITLPVILPPADIKQEQNTDLKTELSHKSPVLHGNDSVTYPDRAQSNHAQNDSVHQPTNCSVKQESGSIRVQTSPSGTNQEPVPLKNNLQRNSIQNSPVNLKHEQHHQSVENISSHPIIRECRVLLRREVWDTSRPYLREVIGFEPLTAASKSLLARDLKPSTVSNDFSEEENSVDDAGTSTAGNLSYTEHPPNTVEGTEEPNLRNAFDEGSSPYNFRPKRKGKMVSNNKESKQPSETPERKIPKSNKEKSDKNKTNRKMSKSSNVVEMDEQVLKTVGKKGKRRKRSKASYLTKSKKRKMQKLSVVDEADDNLQFGFLSGPGSSCENIKEGNNLGAAIKDYEFTKRSIEQSRQFIEMNTDPLSAINSRSIDVNRIKAARTEQSGQVPKGFKDNSIIGVAKEELRSGNRKHKTHDVGEVLAEDFLDINSGEKNKERISKNSRGFLEVERSFSKGSKKNTELLANENERKELEMKILNQINALENDKIVLTFNDVPNHKCSVCHIKFASSQKLQQHSSSHNVPYKCPLCDETFFWHTALLEHMKTHGEGILKQQTRDKKGCVQKCEVCGEVLPDASKLRQHLLAHFRKNSGNCYVCDICRLMISSEEALNKHLQEHDQEIIRQADVAPIKTFDCSSCDLSFSLQATLNCHLKLHKKASASESKASATVCFYCGKDLKHACYLKIHLRIHTGEKPFHCSFCEKSFSCQSTLNNHMSMHTGIKQHVCEVCGQAFSRRSKLTIHFRKHFPKEEMEVSTLHAVQSKSVLNKQQCPICLKFFHKNYFKEHREKHLDRKRIFECTHCDKSFLTRAVQVRHMKIHSQSFQCICEHCGKGFLRKSELKTHLYRHSDKNPFTCDVCGCYFKTPKGFRNHKKKNSCFHKNSSILNNSNCTVKPAEVIKTTEKIYSKEELAKINKRQCPICNKLVAPGYLSMHKKIHKERKRKYECTKCSLKFIDKKVLAKHQRTHTNYRPFQCTIPHCRKFFFETNDLKKHIERHRKNDPSRFQKSDKSEEPDHLDNEKSPLDNHNSQGPLEKVGEQDSSSSPKVITENVVTAPEELIRNLEKIMSVDKLVEVKDSGYNAAPDGASTDEDGDDDDVNPDAPTNDDGDDDGSPVGASTHEDHEEDASFDAAPDDAPDDASTLEDVDDDDCDDDDYHSTHDDNGDFDDGDSGGSDDYDAGFHKNSKGKTTKIFEN